MKEFNVFLIPAFLLLIWSCGHKPGLVSTQVDARPESTKIILDTVYVDSSAEEDTIPNVLPIYRAEAERNYDLIHTRLDLAFDWEKEYVLGEAYIDLTAYYYPIHKVVLDAVNFDIHAVKLSNADGKDIDYEYDGEKLTLLLKDELKRTEEIRVYIDYTAKPSEADISGSAAISSNKGLFFINAQGNDPNKPKQIWTQGEPESNSRWFPTFDNPNERMTQEMYITVADKYEILTNGTQQNVQVNDNGTRTEYWKFMTGEGHAPYLFMLAIGDYAVVEDTWNGIPIQYYVEKEYKEDAALIFNHTKEMLTFFSDILDYPYPWDKFSQVVVRDYVSGAMENTTAVVFGEFVQKHADELITSPNDRIVAHEMFHHWFGDLVTTESWANIVLNEGFANYSEYLWKEYKYGSDNAEIHEAGELKGYLQAESRSDRPVVYYQYSTIMSMFDAHAYNKGGLILNMLRNYLGDELFFDALHYYLTTNVYTATEIADLRLAFEEVSGQDLHWFFNQWYHTPGYPVLKVDDTFNSDSMLLSIHVEQVQDPEKSKAIFKLPTTVAVYYSPTDVEHYNLNLIERDQTITLPLTRVPRLVLLDPERTLLALINNERTAEELALLVRISPNTYYKIQAFNDLQYKDNEAFRNLRKDFLHSDSWYIRRAALRKMDYTDNTAAIIRETALNDSRAEIRILALEKLGRSSDTILVPVLMNVIDTAFALEEQLTALEALYKLNEELALKIAEKYQDQSSSLVNATLSTIYSQEKDPQYLPFFRKEIASASGYGIMGMMVNFSELVALTDVEKVIENIDFLADQFNKSGQSFITRFFLVKGVYDIKNKVNSSDKYSMEEKDNVNSHVTEILTNFLEKAQNARLKNVIKRFL